MSQSYVVFGAYGGIGSALCRRLAKKGAHLLLAGRDEERMATLASEFGAETFCLDASNLRQVESCMKRAGELHGQVNGVANCVGSLLLKPAHLLSEEEWDATVATNLKSAFAVVRAAAITMAQKGGSVVLLSTAAARIGLANHEAISAAKAGIEGLALAASASYVDKGRGVGGRLATRGFEGGRFDYGAQFFTVRNPAFRPLINEWLATGIVTPWSEGFVLPDGRLKNTGEVHYRGAGGMRMIAKHLAHNLDVRSQIEVTATGIEKGIWKVLDAIGNVFMGKALILTPPVPQSLALLNAGNVPLGGKSVQGELSRFTYNRCIAVMAILHGPSRIPPPGGIWFSGEPMAWVADNTQKGICAGADAGSSITMHAGPVFSRAHWDDATRTAGFLLQRAAPWLGARVKHFQTHRWKFSQPTHIHDEPVLSVRCPAQLAFAGDAFGGARVEGATLSGLAAAACL